MSEIDAQTFKNSFAKLPDSSTFDSENRATDYTELDRKIAELENSESVNTSDNERQSFSENDTPTFAESDTQEQEQEQYADNDTAHEEEAPPPPKPQKQRTSYRSNLAEKLSEAQRRNYQQEYEMSQLREELNKYQAIATQSTKTALQHYEDAAKQRLESAKSEHKRALEYGDIEAQSEAAAKIALAGAEYQNVAQLKIKEAALNPATPAPAAPPYPPYYPPNPYQAPAPAPYPPPSHINALENWNSQNTWMNEESPSYDPWLAAEVHKYAEVFNNNLREGGVESQIFSPEYFNKINEHVNKLRQTRYQPSSQQTRSSLNMQPSPHRVSGVNSSRTNQGRVSPQRNSLPELTPAERAMAQKCGIDEKVMRYHVAKHMSTQATQKTRI